MTASLRPRELVWQGCANVRDLGGLPLEGGGATMFGVVVRADNVGKLTPEGWRALLDYGVRRVVDLRWPEEIDEDPPADAPVEVVHVPLFGEHRLETRYEGFAEIAAAVPDAAEFVRRLYGRYLDEHPKQFAAAANAVATADGVVAVHCRGGKDRTGLVSALLLRTVGVGIEPVAADYGLSDIRRLSERGLMDGLSPAQARARRFLLEAPAEGVATLLRDVDERYGSAAGYLEQAGVEREVLAEIRRRLGG